MTIAEQQGLQMRYYRYLQRTSVQSLARQLNYAETTIRSWEAGKTSIRADALPALAEKLHCNLQDIAGDNPSVRFALYDAMNRTTEAKSSNTAALGRELRAARERRGWSQETLAEKLGMFATDIGKIERGARVPSVSLLVSLRSILE